MLTQEELKKHLNYDLLTGIFTRLIVNSRRLKVGSVAGSMSHGYLYIRVNTKKYSAHSLAWLYVYGYFPSKDIDHVNMNRGDNRIDNLREATRSENKQNQKKSPSSNKSSHLLGVTWHKKNKKWQSQIFINGKRVHIGTFDDKYKAHEAYLEKKRQIHPFCTI